MQTSPRIAALCGCLAILSPTIGLAQSGTREADVAAALDTRIRVGSPIKVDAGTNRLVGYYQRRTADSLYLEYRGSRFAIGLTEVSAIQGSSYRVMRTAMVGSLIGVLVGMPVAAMIARAEEPCDYCFTPGAAAIVAGIPLGFAAGTIVGFGVGVTRRVWTCVYDRGTR